MKRDSINVFKLGNMYLIKKNRDSKFFSTSEDSILIQRFNFSALLKFMLFNGILSPKVLEGVLDEYHNYGK